MLIGSVVVSIVMSSMMKEYLREPAAFNYDIIRAELMEWMNETGKGE